MFTGLVQSVCSILTVGDHAGGRRLTVRIEPQPDRPVRHGDSVAIDGVCLTASAIDGAAVSFDVIAETLGRTTLGRRRAGDQVNVERALRVGDELGGHFVQGHVDGLATLARRRESSGEVVLHFQTDAELVGQMIPKGSIAVDGVSLTLVEVDHAAERFSVALIPTTLACTTLGDRRPGQQVNIETDVLGKWVRRYIPHEACGGLTMDKLRQAGFVG